MLSFHTVLLTHQSLVANIVFHQLLPGEQSREKAGVNVEELFKALNKMSAEKEEIEIETTKSYGCLESQKTNAGYAKERTDNSKNKCKRNTGMLDVIENLMKEKGFEYLSRQESSPDHE